MTTPTKFSSTDLGVLQQQLAEWRQGQSGRPRLPAEFWEAATSSDWTGVVWMPR